MPESSTYILYKTRHGSSKEYAEMFRDSFPDATLADLDDFDPSRLGANQTVIIVSRTYLGKIAAQDFLERHWPHLSASQVFLVAVGLLPSETTAGKASYLNLRDDIRKGLAGYWKLPGRIMWQEMNYTERLILKTMKDRGEGRIDPGQAHKVAKEIRSQVG